MTTLAYLRQARLEIEPPGIAIAGLRIQFEIRIALTPESSPSTITVTNLSEDVAAQIEKEAAVRLSAGYVGSPLDRVYEGEIQRIEHERAEHDRETHLLLAGVQQSRRTAAVFAQSYAGQQSLHTVVRDLAATLGLPVGSLDAIPNLRIEDYAYLGKAEDALTGLLRPRGIEWFIADGEIQFSERDRPGRPSGLVISAATGMIGSPSRTEEGARVRMRLNPRLALNTNIRIASAILDGDYKITTIIHRGDTWDGDWVSECEGVSL